MGASVPPNSIHCVRVGDPFADDGCFYARCVRFDYNRHLCYLGVSGPDIGSYTSSLRDRFGRMLQLRFTCIINARSSSCIHLDNMSIFLVGL